MQLKISIFLINCFWFQINVRTGSPRYCGLFTYEFASSHWQNWSKMPILKSKKDFLSANSVFAVQNDGTYLSRITRETCTLHVNFSVKIFPCFLRFKFVMIFLSLISRFHSLFRRNYNTIHI